MAEIYLGELRGPRRFRKRVVVKLLKEEHRGDPEQQSMFSDEARVGSRLQHPNIPQVLELGEWGGRPYMIQEYVEGPSLVEVLRRERQDGRLDMRLACRVAADVAMALHHAHGLTDEAGKPLRVIHRDVSPSNVLVGLDGGARLIDFGVARFEDRDTHTSSDVLKGKLRYMAPETVLEGRVSPQSDLFGLGVVLYMTVTGHPPWRTSEEVGERLHGRFPRPRDRTAAVPEALDAIILRCLATRPEDRYPDGEALASALRGWLAEAHPGFGAAQVAARLAELFPGGADDWLPADTEAARPRPRSRGWVWAGAAAAGLGLAIGASALVALAVAMWPDDEAAALDVTTLLDEVEAAIAADNMADAARLLRALSGVDAPSAAWVSRRQAAADEVDVWRRVTAIDALAASDQEGAWADAKALLAERPDHPRVTALVSRLRPAAPAEVVVPPERAGSPAEGPAAAPAPAPRPRPRPAPPAPAPPFLLKVEGGPDGAEVVVDGRVVGTVPAQVVLDAGRHDVALRKDGFVQRREHLDDVRDGKTRTIRLVLEPVAP